MPLTESPPDGDPLVVPRLPAAPERVHALLDAVLTVGSDLELAVVLRRIVDAAADLSDARYAALAVLDPDGGVAEFLVVGVDDQTRARLGAPPRGHGILGLLVQEPRPLRLANLSDHPASAGFPPGHPPMATFLGVPVAVHGEVFGNLYLTEKRGGLEFDAEDESVVSALALAAGVAIHNARLYEAARRRQRWVAAGAEVSSALLAGTELEDVLLMVAERTREILGAEAAFVALPADQGRLLVEVVSGAAHVPAGTYLDEHDPVCLELLSSGSPVLLTSEQTAALLGVPGPAGSALLPLGHPGSWRGLLGTVTAAPAAIDPAALAEAGQFATQAALALQEAERRADTERLLVLEDRDRIARDLHDLVIQRIFAVGMQLESLNPTLDDPDAAARVRRAVDDLDETVKEIRTTVYGLQTAGSSDAPKLRTRLLDTLDAGAALLGCRPAARLSGLVETRVPDAVGEHLVAVLRECLTNAARHSGCDAVDVSVDVDDALVLRVRDNGRGRPASSTRLSGLRNLEQRARQLGGQLVADNTSEGGFEVIWSVPLHGG